MLGDGFPLAGAVAVALMVHFSPTTGITRAHPTGTESSMKQTPISKTMFHDVVLLDDRRWGTDAWVCVELDRWILSVRPRRNTT